MPKTGFDKWLENKLKDPAFAVGYEMAKLELESPEVVKAMMVKANKTLRVLFRFQMAYVGWECDSEGFVVEDENKERHIILTNHGSPYFAKREDLVNQINLYQSWIARTTDALATFDLGAKSE